MSNGYRRRRARNTTSCPRRSGNMRRGTGQQHHFGGVWTGSVWKPDAGKSWRSRQLSTARLSQDGLGSNGERRGLQRTGRARPEMKLSAVTVVVSEPGKRKFDPAPCAIAFEPVIDSGFRNRVADELAPSTQSFGRFNWRAVALDPVNCDRSSCAPPAQFDNALQRRTRHRISPHWCQVHGERARASS